MKALRNIPGLVKRHYEKVILALALLVLIGAVVYLNQMKDAENEKILTYEKGTLKRKPKPVQVVDISVLSSAMSHATNPPALSFTPPHNLFNPVKWQQRPDLTRIKAETGTELGIDAMQITAIAPLQTLITLDSQSGSGVNMSVTQEASTNRYFRQRLPAYLTTNTPSERIHRTSRGAFTLRDLRLLPDGAEADIELADGTKLTVTPTKPFSRIEGYKADLFYPPEKQSFKERRVGDPFTVAGEDYNIVAITTNEVVVSARSNDRRTIIRSNAP